jgi:D-alanyl-lipoteichoic acid acyltransferase DltB (MBOAT superfamily)
MLLLSFWEGWATSLSYTFQLYFDFSGYSDMAIGLALLFNIRLPINFNSPYRAKDIQEFWRRWHITLSRFLRDYIYIPLGGNRTGRFATYYNIMITFILGGIWHGAGWTFIFWGLIHGLALVIHRAWSSFGFRLWGWVAWFVTFNFINISWVFFRAKEWRDAIKVLNAMFSTNFIYTINHIEATIITLGFIVTLLFKNSISYLHGEFEFNFKQIVFFVALSFISILVIRLGAKSEFLYFNF